MTKEIKKISKHFAFVVLFTGLLIEIFSFILVSSGYISSDKPDYIYVHGMSSIPFWADINPYFGVWHTRKQYRHIKECFNVLYETNSVGAVDKERDLESVKPRVVVLGDSFMEGWGVETQQRLSNLLEDQTGIEFLNFGTSGNFSSTQYYQMYKHIAKNFSHEFILIGVLPDNDFIEDDFNICKNLFETMKYRPYWIGQSGSYELIYYPETIEKSASSVASFEARQKTIKSKLIEALESYTYTYNVYKYFRLLINYQRSLKNSKKELAASESMNTEANYSGYYDYTKPQFDRLKFSLTKISAEAIAKKIIILTLPRYNDLLRYSTNKISPLNSDLTEFCTQMGFTYIDLLPFFYEKYGISNELFLSCDGHWSAKGHGAAAELLIKKNIFGK